MENKFAEVFPPGEFLQDELDAREWTQSDLAEIIGKSPSQVNAVINGRTGITPSFALEIGEALGTGAEFWMNLESQYQLSKVASKEGLIARKARLYQQFPIREMVKREWIKASPSIEILEQQIIKFFNMDSINSAPKIFHAAKKSSSYEGLTEKQLAWLFAAKNLAEKQILPTYNQLKLKNSIATLKSFLLSPEEARHVSRTLSECGVGFVIVEALPGSKIDGACFWLPNGSPVIVMSLRLNRVDNFWFVLRHEIEHVLHGHGKKNGFQLDQDIDFSSQIEEEKIANEAAAEFCVSQAQLNDFIIRMGAYFPEDRILMFSQRIGVHPGLVVGQLQRRLDRWGAWREHLVKMSHIVSQTTPTDGFGVTGAF